MSVRPLPDYPPKTVTESSNPSRTTLTSTAAPRDQRLSLIAAEGAFVPFGYGRDIVGGIVPKATVWNGQLVLLVVWCLGEIDAVEDVMLSSGEALPGGVTLTDYTGTTSQGVDSTLASAFPGWSNNLVATVEGQSVGLAYTVAVIPATVTTGVPELVAKLRLRKVYDPRDVGQDEGDPSTWLWSENPALAKADLETSALYGRGRSIDWDSVDATADACDALVSGEKRRLIGLMLDKQATVDAWSATLNGYAKCFTIDDGDQIKLLADRPRAVSRSITDDDIIHDSSGAPELKMGLRGLEDVPTVLRVIYTNTTGDQWRDATAYAKASGVDAGTTEWRESVIRLPGIHRYSQARREATERINAFTLADLDVELVVVDSALEDQVGDVLNITSARGLSAKPFTLFSVEPVEPGRWRLIAAEYQAGVYSDVVESDPTVGDTDLPNPAAPPALTGLVLDEEVYQRKDGTYSSRIRATWTAPTTFPYVQRYLVLTYDGATLVFTGDANSEEYVTPAIQEAVTYTITVAIVSTTGAVGTEDSDDLTAEGKKLIPGDVPNLTAYEFGGQLILAWGRAVDIDIWRYEVRYGPVGTAWEDATVLDLVDGLSLTSTALAAGAWKILVKAIDSVRQESATAITKDVTVTLDSNAFLVDEYTSLRTNGAGMSNYDVRPDSAPRWITDSGAKITDTSFTTYQAVPLARIQAEIYWWWRSTTVDFGAIITGTFTAIFTFASLRGQLSAVIEVSTNAVDWEQSTGLSAKGGYRFARILAQRVDADAVGLITDDAVIRLDATVKTRHIEETTHATLATEYSIGENFTQLVSIILSVTGTTAAYALYDNIALGNPTTFDVRAYDSDGVQVSDTVAARVEGI